MQFCIVLSNVVCRKLVNGFGTPSTASGPPSPEEKAKKRRPIRAFLKNIKVNKCVGLVLFRIVEIISIEKLGQGYSCALAEALNGNHFRAFGSAFYKVVNR